MSNDLFKGTLQTIILNLLDQNEKMYGYEITQKVKAITQGELLLKEGALYLVLHKLEAEGLLETSTEIVENSVRKYYAITLINTWNRINISFPSIAGSYKVGMFG